MDRTAEFQLLTGNSYQPRTKRYNPLDYATSILIKINKMKSHLSKYGHDYLNTYGCLPGASIMTEEMRNKLDQDVEEFINVCIEKKKVLESEIRIGTTSPQVIKHRETVIKIVMRVFNDFVNYHTQLRKTKMNRYMEKERFDRLGCRTSLLDPSNMSNHSLESDAKSETISDIHDDYRQQSIIASEHEMTISEEEIQALAVENTKIHEELLTLDDEIKMITNKVAHISRLQELFTEKVIEQEVDLNNLHETTIRSSENIREGNELIRAAMMKDASTRVFILFYVTTLGLTILFLDWYNP